MSPLIPHSLHCGRLGFGFVDGPLWLQGLPRVRRDAWKLWRVMPRGYPTAGLLLAKGSDIFRADHDGRNAHKLLTTAGRSRVRIDFSRRVARIRFTVTLTTVGVSSLWEARADGSNPHLLLSPDWNNPPQDVAVGGHRTESISYLRKYSCGTFQSLGNGRPQSGFWRQGGRRTGATHNGPSELRRPGPKSRRRESYSYRAGSRGGKWSVTTPSLRPSCPFLADTSAAQVDFSRDEKWAGFMSPRETQMEPFGAANRMAVTGFS